MIEVLWGATYKQYDAPVPLLPLQHTVCCILISLHCLFRTDTNRTNNRLFSLCAAKPNGAGCEHSLLLEAGVQRKTAFEWLCVVADMWIWHQRWGLWLHPLPFREVFQRRLPDMQTAQGLRGFFPSHSADTWGPGEWCRVWSLSPRVRTYPWTFVLPKALGSTFLMSKSLTASPCQSWL